MQTDSFMTLVHGICLGLLPLAGEMTLASQLQSRPPFSAA